MSAPQHTPSLPCDHCGYDLTGISPDDVALPQMIRCPECGKPSDVTRLPRPSQSRRRFLLAVLAGASVILIINIFGPTLRAHVAGRSSQGVDPFDVLALLSIALGGAISVWITWRYFLAFQRWSAQEEQASIRHLGPLLVEFFVFCVLDAIVAGVIAFCVSMVVQ